MTVKNVRANLAAALFWAAMLIAKPEPPLSRREREPLRWDRAAAPPNLPEDGTAPHVVSECNCDQVRGLRVTVKGLRIGLDAAQAQAGRDRRTIERANSTIDQLVSDAGVDERDLAQELIAQHAHNTPLDDPRMDGTHAISGFVVTEAMLQAWPIWWRFTGIGMLDKTVVVRPKPSDLVCSLPALAWFWAPLRLPGMNKRGEIQAADMTAEHFVRVEDWHLCETGGTWGLYTGSGTVARVKRGMSDVRAGDIWRPAIFAELDE